MGDEGGREGGLFSANPPLYKRDNTQKREGEAYYKTPQQHHLDEGGTHRCFQYKFEQGPTEGTKKFMWEKTLPRNNPSFFGVLVRKKRFPPRELTLSRGGKELFPPSSSAPIRCLS